ncbi:MAG: hypothetical protein J5944_03220, partial [Lentisphaeria bacterium]|nr:hypothetical protein [Lentisphaeria bacterium]
MKQEDTTGLQCLRILFGQFRHTVNFPALVTQKVLEKYREDPLAELMRLSADQQLLPEQISSGEVFQSYAGPALLRLKSGNWVVALNGRQIASGEGAVIADPSVGPQSLSVRTSELLDRWDGTGIIFRNLTPVDSRRQTLLASFVAIARSDNTHLDIREIMHEYAVGDTEVRGALFREIAGHYHYKVRKVKLSRPELEKSSSVFPCIALKKSGKAAVFCGLRKTQEGETQCVVVDPESEQFNSANRFLFLSEKEFEEVYAGKFLLLKKIYSLTDEDQPFSLRWFIPEFIRYKGIFGQIALMVTLLTLFSLVIPLFFQIVVDKVLVNQAYNTLNVLGVGVLVIIAFNALVSYVRSYLLLFATNKIDISTATKTFSRLMKLPVDFFERVPSGVLLKHMQQTEKIRGFLSGNLFFTLLDLFSLCIFIPFL